MIVNAHNHLSNGYNLLLRSYGQLTSTIAIITEDVSSSHDIRQLVAKFYSAQHDERGTISTFEAQFVLALTETPIVFV